MTFLLSDTPHASEQKVREHPWAFFFTVLFALHALDFSPKGVLSLESFLGGHTKYSGTVSG